MSKFKDLFRSAGFCTVLALCLVAVGLWGGLLGYLVGWGNCLMWMSCWGNGISMLWSCRVW